MQIIEYEDRFLDDVKNLLVELEEYIIDNQKRIWILEIGPRNGGMLIPFLIEKSTGIDLTELTLRQAVGERVSIPTAQHLCYAMSIVHPTDGKTVDLELKTGDKPLKP